MPDFTDAELAAFLDEALPAARCADLETALHQSDELRRRLIEVRGRETAGLHTIGAIWRRSRLSCPDRTELGRFAMQTLDEQSADYIRFHLEEIGCRYCQANLADMNESSQAADPIVKRRQKYFQTSAGYLRK